MSSYQSDAEKEKQEAGMLETSRGSLTVAGLMLKCAVEMMS